MSKYRDSESANTWPGFVDALANILVVMIVVLLLFFIIQIYLGDTLSGQNKEIESLKDELREIANSLSIEQDTNQKLSLEIDKLRGNLEDGIEEQNRLARALDELRIEKELMRDDLTSRIVSLRGERDSLEEQLSEGNVREKSLKEEIVAMRLASETLQKELHSLNVMLDNLRRKDEESQVTIKALGQKLNIALASKVQELAGYRSDFFGRLRELLKDKENIRIVGDRFVFSSEVLFETGSSELQDDGKAQIVDVAKTLIELAETIPDDINWILQVEGHTDDVPIETFEFSSNWDLSSARAVSVVEYLISVGVPAGRLSSAGFSEYQPVEEVRQGTGQDVEIARRKNRRIELRLTQH